MATQTGWITFTGKLGNLIGYCRNGKYFLRSIPTAVRQTNATKKAAQRFGIASSNARLIRQACCPELDTPHNNAMINDLNKWLITTGPNASGLKGFQFNKKTSLNKFLTTPITTTHTGTIHIPAQAWSTSLVYTQLKGKLIAARFDFNTHRTLATRTLTFDIDLRNPHTAHTFHNILPGKGTLILILQIQPCNNTRHSIHKTNIAADIITVIPPIPITRPTIRSNNALPAFNRSRPYIPPRSTRQSWAKFIRLIDPRE